MIWSNFPDLDPTKRFGSDWIILTLIETFTFTVLEFLMCQKKLCFMSFVVNKTKHYQECHFLNVYNNQSQDRGFNRHHLKLLNPNLYLEIHCKNVPELPVPFTVFSAVKYMYSNINHFKKILTFLNFFNIALRYQYR
jgi:hypothetical protein